MQKLTKDELLKLSPEQLAERLLAQQDENDELADKLADVPAEPTALPRVKHKGKSFELQAPRFKVKLTDKDQEDDGGVFKTFTAATLTDADIEKILAIKGQQILKPV